MLLASTSDLDDLIPTLVAYQVEWNKLHAHLLAGGRPRAATSPTPPPAPRRSAAPRRTGCGSARRGATSSTFLDEVHDRRLNLRIRMLGGSQAGYARMTRRWWAPVRASMEEQGLGDRPVYFVSSNTALDRQPRHRRPRGRARPEIVRFVEEHGPEYLREELDRFREGHAEGSWENFLYFGGAAVLGDAARGGRGVAATAQAAERAVGVTHISSRTALRVSAQVIALDRLDPAGLDPRLGAVDAERLAALGRRDRQHRVSARPRGVQHPARADRCRPTCVRGVYVLGKAATLNADVGDVLISGVVHDEHSGSTYWLDNAFSFDDIAPFLRFGSGLDNQRAVTVKSTFLQNREYLDFYYREAYTVVEMEAGPFCNAVYEIADADRYPVGEAVNFAKLPIDFGIIHYASDTPYTQARTLGARGLSYYGMDSTYASSLAILRRVFKLEGIIDV